MDRVEYQSLIVQDIVNLDANEELNVTPWYQRRSVWSNAQKSYLINTLFEKKPIPAIYVRHNIDPEKAKSIREIVDGQQRIRTILAYCEDAFSAKHPSYSKKVKFSQLKRKDRDGFLLTSLPIGYLLGATDSDVIDIFGRINSISKSLNAQEKRNAAYSGEMKQLCLEQSSSRLPFWRNYQIFSATNIARMQEVQFVSDIVFNLINGLSDFKPKDLDSMYKIYDEEFDRAIEIEDRLDKVFDLLVSISPEAISDTIFARQPILFSLILVLDSCKKVSSKNLEAVLLDIDALFHSEDSRSAEDIEFGNACLASTQRIAQRRVRDEYIRKFF